MDYFKNFEGYTGESPIPADHREYWDRALLELEKTPVNLSMTKADFCVKSADAYDLYFDGLGGARVYAKCLVPKGASKENKMGALLMFHGYGGSSEDWSKALSFCAQGFVTLSLDVRGQAGKSEDNLLVKGSTLGGQLLKGIQEHPDKLFFRYVYTDTVRLARIAMGFDFVDEKNVCAYGMSQGGALCIALAGLESRIRKIVYQFPFLSDFKKAYKMGTVGPYNQIGDYFANFDPNHLKEDEIFLKLGYIDVANLAKYIKAKVMFFTGLKDNTCPPITQFASYNRIQSEKQVFFYPECGHGYLPGATDKAIAFLLEK